MNAILDAPLQVRLAGLVAVGFIAGSLINWAIYALAWNSRPISPWQFPHSKAGPREWFDRLPVLGWLGLRREAAIHGAGHWIRPLAIELACGMGLAALYWWEITYHLAPPIAGVAPPTSMMLHTQFASHAILFGLMLAATFIDFDEQTIPDEITIPGALIGLLLAACWADSHLPVIRIDPVTGAKYYGPLLLTSTNAWPAWLNAWQGLALAVAGLLAWAIALIPARATLRRGWRKGMQYYFVSMFRLGQWWKLLLLALTASLVTAVVWLIGGPPWQSLLTSITGLVFGGAMIWAVRIVGWAALRKEAMGFGDVTLMAMIGSFLGWQACLIIFFLSPFAALVVSLIQVILTRRRDIAFGPYLCLAAAITIVKWADIWDFVAAIFAAGWLVPAVAAICLVLMMGLLMLWRIIEQLLRGTS